MKKIPLSKLQNQILSGLPTEDDNIEERILNLTAHEAARIDLSLKKDEKVAMYQDIKMRIEDGQSPDDIARDVVLSIESLLIERAKRAKGKTGPKSPIFRRVDQGDG